MISPSLKRMFSCFLPLAAIASALASPSQAADFVAGELIVKYRAGDVTAVRSSLSPAAALDPLAPGIARVVLPPGQSLTAAMKRFAADPHILQVQPNYIKHTQLVPDDSDFSYQWGMQNSGQEVLTSSAQRVAGRAGADVSAVSAWNVSTGDRGVVIAIIDTGVELTHPELSANLWTNPGEAPNNGVDDDGNGYIDDVHGWDWADGDNTPADGNGHGTHIAGIIAARGNNRMQIAGLNWQVSLMVLRAFDSQGVSSTAHVVRAIRYAVDNGARIINASYGALGGASPVAPGFDAREFEAYRYAADRGVLVIAAACNEAINNDGLRACVPASYDLPNIVAVAATDQNDRLAGFSSWGEKTVDLAAPGVNIATTPWRTKAADVVAVVDGTSIASSFVSGGAALLLARGDELGLALSATRLRGILMDHVDQLPATLGGRVGSGGRLNIAKALAALDALATTQEVAPPSSAQSSADSNSGNGGPRTSSTGGGGGALLWLLILYGWRLWCPPLPSFRPFASSR